MFRRFFRAFLTFAAALTLAAGARAEGTDSHPYVAAMRSLSINRSLLTKAESEYRTLREAEQTDPSLEPSKRLGDLRYKIEALKEDAERLRAQLPGNLKADDFLKEMVQRQKVLGQTRSVVNSAEEDEFEEKVRSIYQMHEKALSAVADGRYGDAEKLYQGIILMSPDDDEAYLLLGHTCLLAGNYEKAGQAFGNAIHIDPVNTLEIPRMYENILLENPSDDDALTQLGFAHLLIGNAGEARQSFEEALEINPANLEAKRGLSELTV